LSKVYTVTGTPRRLYDSSNRSHTDQHTHLTDQDLKQPPLRYQSHFRDRARIYQPHTTHGSAITKTGQHQQGGIAAVDLQRPARGHSQRWILYITTFRPRLRNTSCRPIRLQPGTPTHHSNTRRNRPTPQRPTQRHHNPNTCPHHHRCSTTNPSTRHLHPHSNSACTRPPHQPATHTTRPPHPHTQCRTTTAALPPPHPTSHVHISNHNLNHTMHILHQRPSRFQPRNNSTTTFATPRPTARNTPRTTTARPDGITIRMGWMKIR
jgi:hypothetical protein